MKTGKVVIVLFMVLCFGILNCERDEDGFKECRDGCKRDKTLCTNSCAELYTEGSIDYTNCVDDCSNTFSDCMDDCDLYN